MPTRPTPTRPEPVRVGVIGCGQIGKSHIAHYADQANVELVALADIDPTELDRVADRHGVADRYTDFRELLARDDIAAVDVCLHNNFHMPVTVAALEHGKHVFCEKPMAGSWVDAQTMWLAAEAADLKLCIQNRLYFTPETIAASQLVHAGQLGDIYYGRSTGFRRMGRPYVDGYGSPTFVQKRNSGGGALFDMGVYHICQLLWLMDNPDPLRISGQTYQKLPMHEQRRRESGYDVEELAMGMVRLAGGITLDITEAWAMHLDGLEGSFLLGDRGGVRLEPFGWFHTHGDLAMDSTPDLRLHGFRRQFVHQLEDTWADPQSHWIAALQGRVDLLPTAQIALNCMLISEGIYLSAQRECEVSAEEVKAASVSTAVSL